jgi:hypothetical protein
MRNLGHQSSQCHNTGISSAVEIIWQVPNVAPRDFAWRCVASAGLIILPK